MMGRALLIVGWLATLGLVVAAGLGYTAVRASPTMTPHILLAFSSSLLILFSHCWVMFYLIGTGTAIRQAVEEYGFEPSIVEETKDYKNDSYPWLMAAMGLVIATFVLGGGSYAGALGSWLHHALFYITLIVQVRTLWIESRVLTANHRLMDDINRRARGAESPV